MQYHESTSKEFLFEFIVDLSQDRLPRQFLGELREHKLLYLEKFARKRVV